MESIDDGFEEALGELKDLGEEIPEEILEAPEEEEKPEETPEEKARKKAISARFKKGEGGRTAGSVNKVYDLKDILLGLIRLQDMRVRRMANEEVFRWTRLGREHKKDDSKKGTRSLDPGLSKEIATVINLVEAMFKVGGGAPDGKVKKKKKEGEESTEEQDQVKALDNMVKKKMAALARKANGG